MLVETYTSALHKAKATSATDTSFPSKIPTGTEPANDGVIDLRGSGILGQNAVFCVPFGAGDDDDAFSMRLIGWRVYGTDPATLLWVPVILAEVSCTMSTAVGVSGKLIGASERFCDTITLVTGNDDVTDSIISPTGNVIAHITVDLEGSQKLEFTFDTTTGDPTNANCLYALL